MSVLRLLLMLVIGSAVSVSASTVGASAGYRLYPGDLLQVHVYDHPDLSVPIRIPADGLISYPLIGDLPKVANMSERTFRDLIKTRLEERYLRQAIVTTTVIEYGVRKAFVMGSVEAPGAVELDPLDTITATQAISQLGGFQDDANRAAAAVIRDDPEQPEHKVAISIPDSDEAATLQQDVVLQAGDLIIVPRLDRAYIIGRVDKPGALNLPATEKLTISKAISLAGGFLKFAKQNEVQLIRSDQLVVNIDVRAILEGKTEDDPVLQPGDTVYVPESRF